jgi:hypothetical protein
MAARIRNREDLERWLRGKPREQAVAFAARAAARVLPLLASGIDARGPRRFADLTLATARATSFARVAAVYPNRAKDLRAAAARAAAAAYAARAADAAAYAARAADAAAYAAYAAGAAAAAAADAAYAAYAADAADAAAEAAAEAADAVWFHVQADARILEGSGVAALIEMPLWKAPLPDWAAENWTRLKAGLREQDRWGFWIAWYEAVLAGHPLWPELDAKTREDLDLRICLIDDDVWAEGPAVVNAKIEQMIAEALPRPQTLQSLEGMPSVFTYGWTGAGRIGVVAGPQNQPFLPHASSAEDHRAFLDAARKQAQRLADDLRARKFDNVRSEYLDALDHYLADLPAAPEAANLVLADGEMRILRALHNDEAGALPAPFAARLRIVQEQHLSLRPFHPEIERLYDAIARGKLAAPLPLDAVEALERTVTAHTPSVFEPDVSAGQEQLKRVPPVVALSPEDARPVEGVILPPPDPVGVPSLARTREFERASALNQIGGVIKSGAELGKGLAGWDVVAHDFWQHLPVLVDWLKGFV